MISYYPDNPKQIVLGHGYHPDGDIKIDQILQHSMVCNLLYVCSDYFTKCEATNVSEGPLLNTVINFNFYASSLTDCKKNNNNNNGN